MPVFAYGFYERFGYGIASSAAAAEVTVARARLRPGVPAGGPVRFVTPKKSWDLLAGIYAQADWPGAIDRPRYWWKGVQYAADRDKGPAYVVVHGSPGAEDGFVRYRPINTDHWFSSQDRTISVRDFVALTPRAHRGLLRFLLSIDLLHRIVLETLPVDHSIEKLVLDERAVRTTSIRDETWLRLVDVEAALAARSYRGPGSVIIGVADAQLPANSGSYAISAAEVKHALLDKNVERLPFEAMTVMRRPYEIDKLQNTYFVLDDFRQLFEAAQTRVA